MPVAAPLGGDAQEDESIRRRQAEFQRLLTVRAGLLTEHNQASKEAQDIETALTATGIALATVQKQIATEQASLAALDKAIANLNAQYNTVNNAATRSLLEAQIISSQTQYRTQTANLEKIQQKAAMYENDIKTFTTKQAEAKKRLDGLSDKGYRVWKDWLALVDPLDRYTRREHEAAIPFFTATIQADARNGGALLARGVAYMRIGKTQEALDDLDAAIRLGEPYLEQALPIRGRLLVSLDRERDGMLDFAQAVKLHKANGMLYVHRGLVYWAQAKYPLAEKDFREASRLGDAEADSLRLLALRYAASPDPLVKDGKKALEFAKRACTLTNDQDWRALVALAAAQAEGGDFEGAMKTVDRALPLAVGDNRKLCQEHRELYASGKPLRTMP
jgi:tetratricopeptide (TPR) repeat protein